MHHPSCPARNGTGGCRCPKTPQRQLPNPNPAPKKDKVTPRPKQNPKSK